ncbi:MAG: heme ABC transporter permease [Microvirga sp.]
MSTSMIRDLANPTRFMSLSGRLLPWIGTAAIATMAVGVYMAFFVAPADYQQGETVRIMYVHVPAASLALFFYVAMAASALGTLVWRHPLAEVSQRAAAPIGAAFALVCLVTGSLWGKPMWGTYWVWDARLTSMLVLFLIYCGILALWHAVEEPGRAARAVSILTLVGTINVVIVKFSVDWWNTLHQPASLFRADGPKIHPSILWPLVVMIGAFTLTGVALHLSGMRTEILRRRVRTLTILEAERLDAGPAPGSQPTSGPQPTLGPQPTKLGPRPAATGPEAA